MEREGGETGRRGIDRVGEKENGGEEEEGGGEDGEGGARYS